jgi:hypothetical protein
MKLLKCLLLYLIKAGVVTETLTIEVFFEGEEAEALAKDL